jgi:hypothetical protein
MAEALNITDTTYAGDTALSFILRPLIQADTVQKGCIHVEDGIKKQRTIPRIDVTNIMQKRAATPTSSGSIAVDGRVIVPQDMMLYIEFNPRDFEAHWQAVNLNPKLIDRDLPPTAEDFVTRQTMARLNEFFELAIWRSRKIFDPSNAAAVTPASKGQDVTDSAYIYFDGLMHKLLNDAATIQVSTPRTLISSGASDGSNEVIVEALNRVYKLVPKALLYKYGPGGLKFHVSYATQQVYEDYLTTTTTFKNNDTTERGINKYKGYEVVPLAGMPDNTIIACVTSPGLDSNLWVGMNSAEDENTLKLAQLQANSELFFLKGLFKMDTQAGFPDFIVLYTKITA